MNNYCPNCGSEVNDEYCTNCGAKVNGLNPEIIEMYDECISGKGSASHTLAIAFTIVWLAIHLFFTFFVQSYFGFFDNIIAGRPTNRLPVYMFFSLVSCFYSFIPFVLAFIFSFVSESKKLIAFHAIFLFFHIILFAFEKF